MEAHLLQQTYTCVLLTIISNSKMENSTNHHSYRLNLKMADLRRSLSTPGETERRYSLITRATLGLYIDSQGYDVNEDVIRVLTEDVNYRLRELVSVR